MRPRVAARRMGGQTVDQEVATWPSVCSRIAMRCIGGGVALAVSAGSGARYEANRRAPVRDPRGRFPSGFGTGADACDGRNWGQDRHPGADLHE